MLPFLDLQAITRQHIDEYKAAINRVVESGWFLQGQEVARFERQYAEYIASASAGELSASTTSASTMQPLECISCANGLDALILILRAYKELGVMHDGDEVIVPANTYIATILAITKNGLVPVLVEPTFEHLEIDPTRIEERISPRTKAICIVHLYGRNAYTDQIGELCRKYGLKLIEDCAQSHGLKASRKQARLEGACAHSFYPGKNLGAFGDAGAVTTSDAALARVIRALANYGSQQKYVFKYEGINSRMSEVDAAVLGVKLKYLDEDNAHRQQLAAFYYEYICNPLVTLPARIPDAENVYHQFPIFCERRDELQQHSADCGIGTLIHYPIPPHLQECYAKEGWNCNLSLPITERIHAQELSIPMNQAVTLEQAAEVVKAINSFE